MGSDPGAIREYVQAAEELGYSHLFVADHVLGADRQFHPELGGFGYSHKSVVHETLVLLGFAAAITTRLRLATGILILPQRQTALVAKQAAEVDVLSSGRLRLGVGIGWNVVEYEALGENFRNRGRRCEEQISVLRALWTQETVEFHGRWHKISHAGINPLPVQRPIPLWIGGGSVANPIPPEPVLRRIARVADGWFPADGFPLNASARETLDRLAGYIHEAGRDPAQVGQETRVRLGGKNPDEWLREAATLKEMGAAYMTVETRWGGVGSPSNHIAAIRRAKELLTSHVGPLRKEGTGPSERGCGPRHRRGPGARG
jgi:probable F420-dependent oxidoreductase